MANGRHQASGRRRSPPWMPPPPAGSVLLDVNGADPSISAEMDFAVVGPALDAVEEDHSLSWIGAPRRPWRPLSLLFRGSIDDASFAVERRAHADLQVGLHDPE